MPWTYRDAKDHKDGLTSAQAKKWAKIANGRLKTCLAEGKSQKLCEASAIKVANAMSVRGGRRKT